MGGSENQFIIKATLLFNGCPAPACPGRKGGHEREELPLHCVIWWRESGWRLMGWKGSRETADSTVVKEKIRQFKKNFTRRRKNFSEQDGGRDDHEQGQVQNTQQGNQEKGTVEDRHGGNNFSCNFCHFQGSMSRHMEETNHCFTAHLQQYLPWRAHTYRGKPKLAIFDLGLVCNICINPHCAVVLERGSVTTLKHVESDCGQFYQREGADVLKWGQNLSAATILDKLRMRKRWVNAGSTGESEVEIYQRDLGKMLRHVCGKCAIQGPLLDLKEHRIHGPNNFFNVPQWECMRCMNDNGVQQELLHEALEGLRQLGTPADHDDTLEKVLIEEKESQRQRVIFVPAVLKVDHQVADVSDEQLHPFSTTVLVPKHPEAMEEIGDEASERANKVKKSLEKITEFFGRRHFLGPVTETLSVLFRSMLAKIRVEQLSKLTNRKKTGKGKVLSRDPPCAAVKDRNPHFAETKKHCLTNTCSFSVTAQEKRSCESAARLHINGQVRIKVQVTLIKKMATESPLLQEIIQENMTSPHGPAPLVSLAPLVLNYLKAKMKLLLKHIITPKYTNWDLDLRFAQQEWTVEMVGFVYCEEFEELNKRIARGQVTASEIAAEVRKHPHLLPTTALCINRLTRDHSITEERAQVIQALAQQHQMDGKPQPLSLLTICTPAGLHVTEEERFLRERAVQLGKAMGQGMNTVEAIVEIMATLKIEGIGNLRFEDDDGRRIRGELLPLLHNQEEGVPADLLLYHILLWKTGGDMMWTMARDSGESQTDAYIPDLLEASGLRMSAEVSSSGDHLLPEEGVVCDELKSLITNADNWREISLLEFVNATLPTEKVAPARGAANQPTVPIVTSKDRTLTWRKALDSDNHSGDAVFQVETENSYVRTNTDVRILYEKRPARMDRMVLGQFACEYILLHPSKKSYEKATSSINEDTQVGPNSDHLVAGTGNLAAPESMKLSDGRIMKRRQDGKAVPILQYSGSISKHGNQLMFSPWKHLEDVEGAQEEEETDDQKSVRLEIFPCSVIPFAEEESRHESG